MKTRNTVFILGTIVSIMALALVSCQEEEFNPALTRTFNIKSVVNGGEYEIKVALPRDYDSSVDKYSTIYVLDGEDDFDYVANTSKEITDRMGVQNALVVSIGYGHDRSFDYTPTKVSSITGGGAEFLAFIETELIPRVENDFKAEPSRNGRVILGHSYGGLFGACVLAVNNNLFGNYIILSPSIWFDNEVTLQLEKQFRAINQNQEQLVFLGIGELENSGRMQAPFEAFYQILHDHYTRTRLSKSRVENMDHMGSKKPNIVKGLNYYFENR